MIGKQKDHVYGSESRRFMPGNKEVVALAPSNASRRVYKRNTRSTRRLAARDDPSSSARLIVRRSRPPVHHESVPLRANPTHPTLVVPSRYSTAGQESTECGDTEPSWIYDLQNAGQRASTSGSAPERSSVGLQTDTDWLADNSTRASVMVLPCCCRISGCLLFRASAATAMQTGCEF
jgi:hypothetical protein